MPLGDEPIVIEPCPQKEETDCGVACLAMLLGVSYADARKAVRTCRDGLSRRQMQNAAKRLGKPLAWVSDGVFDSVGILHLNNAERTAGHYAMVMKGVVYNPADNLMWTDIDSYFKTKGWEPLGVLVRAGEDTTD